MKTRSYLYIIFTITFLVTSCSEKLESQNQNKDYTKQEISDVNGSKDIRDELNQKHMQLLAAAQWDPCTVEYSLCVADKNVLLEDITTWILLANTVWPDLCAPLPDPERTNCLSALNTAKGHMFAAEVKLYSYSQFIGGAQNWLTQLTNQANQLGLIFNFILPVAGEDRVSIASKAFMTEHYLYWASVELNAAIALIGAAVGALEPPELLPARIHAMDINADAFAHRTVEFAEYHLCAFMTGALAVGAAGADFIIRFVQNGGGPFQLTSSGSEHILNTHPVHTFDPQLIDLSNAERIEHAGRVNRTLKMGWSVPADAVWTTDLISPITGQVLIFAGTKLVVGGGYTENNPTHMLLRDEKRFVTFSRGLVVHYSLPDSSSPEVRAVCLPIGGEEIEPGETAFCDFNLDVTGSPTEIANGDLASNHIHVYAMGGNTLSTTDDEFFKFDITYSAPKEAPTDPCFAWDEPTQSYKYICGPSGGGGPGL